MILAISRKNEANYEKQWMNKNKGVTTMNNHKTKQYEFLDNQGTFCLKQPENVSYLYFPIAGEQGIKGALTPTLGGDLKRNQNLSCSQSVQRSFIIIKLQEIFGAILERIPVFLLQEFLQKRKQKSLQIGRTKAA